MTGSYPAYVTLKIADPKGVNEWVTVGRFAPRSEEGHYQLQLEHEHEAAVAAAGLERLVIEIEPCAPAQAKRVTLPYVLGWVLGSLFIGLGLLLVPGWPGFISTSLYLWSAAALMIPEAAAKVQEHLKVRLNIAVRTALIVFMFFVMLLVHDATNVSEEERMEKMMSGTLIP